MKFGGAVSWEVLLLVLRGRWLDWREGGGVSCCRRGLWKVFVDWGFDGVKKMASRKAWMNVRAIRGYYGVGHGFFERI